MTINIYNPSLPMTVSTTYTLPIMLLDYSTPQVVKTSPTVEAGDAILYRKASGTWTRIGNLGTLPQLIGISTKVLALTILDTEIPVGTQSVAVMISDQTSPATWCDLLIVIDVEELVGVGTSDLTVANILAGIFEGTSTIQDFFRLASSVLFGKSTGGGTANPKFRDLGDTKDRISATTTVNGDRTTITRDAT